MDTVLLTILALLFVITIFLSLYHSNTIKVNKEYFGSVPCSEFKCCPKNAWASCTAAGCKWNSAFNRCSK